MTDANRAMLPSAKTPLRGRIESVDNRTLIGWVWNPERFTEPVDFELAVNGVSVGRYVASRLRGDLASKNIGNGHHSFRILLDDKWLANGSNLFEIRVDSCGPNLTATLNVEIGQSSTNTGTGSDAVSGNAGSIGGSPAALFALQTVTLGDDALNEPFNVASIGLTNESEVYQNTLNSAKQKFLITPLPNVFLQLKDKADKRLITYSGDSNRLAVSFEKLNYWFRVVFLIPPIQVEKGKAVDFHLPIQGAQGACRSPTAFVMVFQKNGSFQSAHRFGKKVQIVEDDDSTRLRINARQWAALQREATSREVPLFLTFEFTATGECDFGALSVVVADEADVGGEFRRSDLPIAERLDQIVSNTHSLARVDRNMFLLNEAEIALRMECFATASALLERTSMGAFSELEHKKLYLQLISEVKMAEGDLNALGAILTSNWALTVSNPALFTLASICAPGTTELARVFGRLPNAELNYAYLSRLDHSAEAFQSIQSIEQGEQDSRHLLFAASQLRRTSATLYLYLWNRYLSSFGLSPLKSLDPSAANVLATAEFVAPAGPVHGPKVSVIMAAYNSETTISYAVRSILNQSYSNIELLVCDDCSTDGTLGRILDEMIDPRIRVFRSIGNQGTYNIRNALIERATGEFVTFQDADDFAHPDRLRRQISSLDGAGIDCVIGRWVRVRPDGEVAFFRDQKCLRMSVVSLLARRQTFLDQGKYHPVLCGADSDMFDRLRLRRGRNCFVEIEEPLILGLWSERSLTQQHGLEATEDGYRSKARREFAEISARQRFLGIDLVTHNDITDVAKSVGIFRESRGVHELSIGSQR